MKFIKQIINILAVLLFLNLIQAKDIVEETQDTVEEKKPELILTPGPISGDYKKNDLNETYDDSSIEIECDGTTCTSSSDDVLLDEGQVTISTEGTYILSGELNGQLTIAATKEDLIHLVLRNATITSDFGPAVYGEKCKKLVITTEGINTISDTNNYPESANKVVEEEPVEEEPVEEDDDDDDDDDDEKTKTERSPNACIFISNNLTFNGKGTLNVNANFDEGIRCKKNLKFVSGKINVISKGKAIKAKDSISFKQAEVSVDSGSSGIKATKDTDPEGGFVVIDGGKVIVKAVQDGIHAETHLTINGGYVDVVRSKEGLEGQMIDITGGEVYVNALDDGMNSSKVGSKGGDMPPPPDFMFMNMTDPTVQMQMQNMQGGNGQMPPKVQTQNNNSPLYVQVGVSKSEETETELFEDLEELDDTESESEYLEPLIDDEDSDFSVDETVTLDANEDSEYSSNDEEEDDENEKNYREPGVIRTVLTDIPTIEVEIPTDLEFTDLEFPSDFVEEPQMFTLGAAATQGNANQFNSFMFLGPPPPPPKDYKDDKKVYVRITGGKVHVVVTGGDVDGIDSNGSIYIGEDAEVYIDNGTGSIYGNMAAIDAAGSCIVDGNATVLFTGSRMGGPPGPPGMGGPPGMMDNSTIDDILETFPYYTVEEIQQILEEMKEDFPPPPPGFGPPGFGPQGMEGEGGSGFQPPFPPPFPPPEDEEGKVYQPYIKVSLGSIQPLRTEITIKNSDDEILIQHQPKAKFGELLFTSPKVIVGETYTVIAGDETVTAVATIDEVEEIPTDIDEEIPTDFE